VGAPSKLLKRVTYKIDGEYGEFGDFGNKELNF